ncbi:unnamed protein product, partial [Ectocarpus sp. 8 AP-2014]
MYDTICIHRNVCQPPKQSGSLTISSSFVCRRLRYLELNSWMWEVNGINILVDPVFGTLDFGVPLLVQANKQV